MLAHSRNMNRGEGDVTDHAMGCGWFVFHNCRQQSGIRAELL
jgi:hypothetical protein